MTAQSSGEPGSRQSRSPPARDCHQQSSPGMIPRAGRHRGRFRDRNQSFKARQAVIAIAQRRAVTLAGADYTPRGALPSPILG